MKFSWAVGIALLGISLSGWAQQNSTFKVKKSPPEKQSVVVGKRAVPATASGSTSQDLAAVERQTAKAAAPSPNGAKKTPGTASTLRPVKEKPNPPIDFSGSGEGKISAKSKGVNNRGKDPYQGRLRQKHSNQ